MGEVVAFYCVSGRSRSCPSTGWYCTLSWKSLRRRSSFLSQIRFPRGVSSLKFESRLPSQLELWARPGEGRGEELLAGDLNSGGRSFCVHLFPLLLSFFAFCSAMPCSEAIPAISPSKRPRPAEDSMRLRFVRLSEHATAPTKGSARAAGYDLYSAYDYTLPPMEKALVKTDIQVALPSGCYGRVAPRSGLAAKYFIDVGAGVIDEDYRGNVGVVLFNFGKEKFQVKKGDRIAQLICERIFYPEIEEVQVLDDTERGSGGFGSTGKN
ncbi:deoxyuridine 5'-triphosphate nucleotidohydrolase, mitochondrial isoform X1 [Leptonychotes weddellii]|uniref:Deoxyuridine 5'-triphosphate nucleotidohydrolase n=1 Tax=Leptonychotes weddellii TaxID=9713 RepID=A0A7F8R2K3_LEPWE|nr:deoxyuridine 5'-triphosphate nucleotidohydrolase, mitochondrial isoform X1 [Leptonychotes weddellii]